MSDQQLINAAKAPAVGYNEKDWDKVRSSVSDDFVKKSHRKAEGIDQVLELWQGWAITLPDSRATFDEVAKEHAKLIDTDDVELMILPKSKTFFDLLTGDPSTLIEKQFGPLIPDQFFAIIDLFQREQITTVLPFFIEIR